MVFDMVKEILVDQLGCDEADVTMDASLENDLNADSLDLIDMVMTFEDKFNIEVPDDMAEDVETVADVVRIVEELMKD